MFKVEFETKNAAFAESPDCGNEEIARILEKIAEKIRDNFYTVDGDVPIRDINGYRVGSYRYTPEWAEKT